MKIFVSTTQSQGQRPNDFGWVPDGEWVKFGMICDRDRANPDGGCGCGRAMVGMIGSKATTTFVVADLPVTREEYAVRLVESYEREGWRELMPANDFNAMIDEDVTELLRAAALFPVGAVLEKRLDDISVRRVLPTVRVPLPKTRR